MDDDLLEVWKEHVPDSRAPIGEFRGVLHLRHWLAHGRYWKASLGRKEYDAQAVFSIASKMFEMLSDVEGWPGSSQAASFP